MWSWAMQGSMLLQIQLVILAFLVFYSFKLYSAIAFSLSIIWLIFNPIFNFHRIKRRWDWRTANEDPKLFSFNMNLKPFIPYGVVCVAKLEWSHKIALISNVSWLFHQSVTGISHDKSLLIRGQKHQSKISVKPLDNPLQQIINQLACSWNNAERQQQTNTQQTQQPRGEKPKENGC